MKRKYINGIFVIAFLAFCVTAECQENESENIKLDAAKGGAKSAKGLPSRELEMKFRHERDSIEKPEEIIELIGIKPGMRIGEAGAGEGYFTFHLSDKVGEKGVIYANEISDQEISILEHFAKEFGVLKNIVSVIGKVDDPVFPVNDLDMVVIYHSFHDFEKRAEWLANTRQYLKPGGILAIIDGYNPVHTDLTKDKVTELGVKAGFRFLLYKKPSWHVHMFVKE